MSTRKKKKPVTQSGSIFMARHGLVSIQVPVTEEVRELCGQAATAAGHRAASRWAATVLEGAAREALALPPAPAVEDGIRAALADLADSLRAQADALDSLAKKNLSQS